LEVLEDLDLSKFFFAFLDFFLSLSFSVFFFSGLPPTNPSSISSPKPDSYLSGLDSFFLSFGLALAFPLSSSSEPCGPKSPPKPAFFASCFIALIMPPLAFRVVPAFEVFLFLTHFDFS